MDYTIIALTSESFIKIKQEYSPKQTNEGSETAKNQALTVSL